MQVHIMAGTVRRIRPRRYELCKTLYLTGNADTSLKVLHTAHIVTVMVTCMRAADCCKTRI